MTLSKRSVQSINKAIEQLGVFRNTKKNFKPRQIDKFLFLLLLFCYLEIRNQKSISNPAAHKRQAVHLCGMKQLFTKVTHSFWRKSQLIRVRRSRRSRFCGTAEGATPVRIQPIFNISLTTTENASGAIKSCMLPTFLLHYSLFETKLSSVSIEVDGGA